MGLVPPIWVPEMTIDIVFESNSHIHTYPKNWVNDPRGSRHKNQPHDWPCLVKHEGNPQMESNIGMTPGNSF